MSKIDKVIEVGDHEMSMAKHAIRLGISEAAIYARLKNGWTDVETCSFPKGEKPARLRRLQETARRKRAGQKAPAPGSKSEPESHAKSFTPDTKLQGGVRPAPLTPITFKGETRTLRRWAERLGISVSSLQDRFIRGWSTEGALTASPRPQRSKKPASVPPPVAPPPTSTALAVRKPDRQLITHQFPLRPDFVVPVGLPADLTPMEAARMSRWLEAMAFGKDE